MSALPCHVYKSLRREETYVYLAARDDFDCLPAALRDRLMPLSWVLDLDLHPERRLAREDAVTVIENLQRNRFHLQLPPAPVTAPEGLLHERD